MQNVPRSPCRTPFFCVFIGESVLPVRTLRPAAPQTGTALRALRCVTPLCPYSTWTITRQFFDLCVDSGERGQSRALRNRRPSERVGCGRYIFLMNRGRRELQPIEPDYVLDVVAVGPEGVEEPVRADGDISVVAKEAAAEAVLRIDRLSGDLAGHAGRDVRNDVIQTCIVDIPAKPRAVDSTLRGRRRACACLPGRLHVCSICRDVQPAGRRSADCREQSVDATRSRCSERRAIRLSHGISDCGARGRIEGR